MDAAYATDVEDDSILRQWQDLNHINAQETPVPDQKPDGMVFPPSQPRGYPVQNTTLPEELPAELAEMLTKDANFEHDRKNRVFEDKAGVIWDRSKKQLYDYYLVATGEKLDAKFYRVYSAIGSTMGVTVAKSSTWGPTILGRSPSMIPGHLRPWSGKLFGFDDDDNVEVVRTLNGGVGIAVARRKLRSRHKRRRSQLNDAPEETDQSQRPAREKKRAEPWKDFGENDIFQENGDEGSFLMSEDERSAVPQISNSASNPSSSIPSKKTRRYVSPTRLVLSDDDDDVRAPRASKKPERYGRKGLAQKTVHAASSSMLPPRPLSPVGHRPSEAPSLRIVLKYRKPHLARQQPTPDDENDREQHQLSSRGHRRELGGSKETYLSSREIDNRNKDNESIADSDSDSVIEVVTPDNMVKTEEPAPAQSGLPAAVAHTMPDGVLFLDENNEVVRVKQWAACDSVQKLFSQAVAARLFSNSKGIGVLSASIAHLDVEIPIMKDDADDFLLLADRVAELDRLKQEDDRSVTRIEIRLL